VTDFRRHLHDESPPLLHAVAAPPAAGRGCFDDEIAIDFPSMGAVVERMRDGLLGADAATDAHNAAISLSAREAFAGATVALEVPLRGTCRRCGGRGETWAEPCGTCAGSGQCSTPHHFRVAVPAGVTDGTRFRFLIASPQNVPTRIEVTVLVA
jgi:hypothetical protein